MNYELLEQLKKAGFPHPFIPAIGVHKSYYPSLSELIEACGEQFVLEKVNSGGLHQWTAGTFIDWNGDIEHAHTADSAEEAVARLWLALQESKRSA